MCFFWKLAKSVILQNSLSAFSLSSKTHTSLDLLIICFSMQDIFSILIWNVILKESQDQVEELQCNDFQDSVCLVFPGTSGLKISWMGYLRISAWQCFWKAVFLTSSYINCLMWNYSNKIFLRVVVQFSSATLSAALATNALQCVFKQLKPVCWHTFWVIHQKQHYLLV